MYWNSRVQTHKHIHPPTSFTANILVIEEYRIVNCFKIVLVCSENTHTHTRMDSKEFKSRPKIRNQNLYTQNKAFEAMYYFDLNWMLYQRSLFRFRYDFFRYTQNLVEFLFLLRFFFLMCYVTGAVVVVVDVDVGFAEFAIHFEFLFHTLFIMIIMLM